MKKHIFINVYLSKLGFVPAGVLIYDEKTFQTGFSYYDEYIANNLPPLNPSTLNWRKENKKNFLFPNSGKLDKTFAELLPSDTDWSYQVLLSRYPEYEYMSMFERLYFLKSRTVGGLQSHLEEFEDEASIIGQDWLERICSSSIDLYLKRIGKIPYLNSFIPMTTYGGVRPKCTYQDEENNLWIAKFNLPDDDFNFAKIEKACMDMANDLELKTAYSEILSLNNQDIFLSYRFDRQGNVRAHSLPFYALSDGIIDKYSSNNYSGKNPLIMKDILEFSDFKNRDTLMLVQKFIFDIAVNNTDNHLRNIRLILNSNNLWEVAPLFDITMTPYVSEFVYNPAGLKTSELYLENPELAEHLAKLFNVPFPKVKTMIEKTKAVVNSYEKYANDNKFSENDLDFFSKGINIGLSKKSNSLKPRKAQVSFTFPKLTPKKGL